MMKDEALTEKLPTTATTERKKVWKRVCPEGEVKHHREEKKCFIIGNML